MNGNGGGEPYVMAKNPANPLLFSCLLLGGKGFGERPSSQRRVVLGMRQGLRSSFVSASLKKTNHGVTFKYTSS